MPTLPLYTPNPPHPNASHQVIAPGGYERWYFDAESADGSLHLVAAFAQGWFNDPDTAGQSDYLSRLAAYVRRPTRHAPSVPADYPSISLAVYEHGRLLTGFVRACGREVFRASREQLDLSAGANAAAIESGGTIRLRLEDASTASSAHVSFSPIYPSGAKELVLADRQTWPSDHRWVVAAPLCGVDAFVEVGKGRPPIRFSGRGYHDHLYGSGVIQYHLGNWLRGRVFLEDAVFAFCASNRRGASAAVRCVKADATGVVEVPVTARLPSGDSFETAHFEPAELTLSRPRVLSSGRHSRVLLYDAATSASPGRGLRALCEWTADSLYRS